MQRASEARGTRTHDQNIRVQPLSLDTHILILAEGHNSLPRAFEDCFCTAIE
jgi:hypothetical protein